MSPRARRLVTAAMLAVGTSAVVLLGFAPSATAQAPDVVAWWNAANVGDPAPTPPNPPDVKDGDLLVQGSNAIPVSSPLSAGTPASAQAIAGLRFDVAPTAIVGNLTLKIDGTAPPAVSVVACRATSNFTAETNGQWSDVPSYDGTACVPAALKGDSLVFAGISKLVAPGSLSIVVLPGSLDRVVLAPPGPAALQVSSSSGLGPAAPPLGSDNGQGTSPSGGSSGSSAGGGGAPVGPVGGSAVAPAPPTVGLPGGTTTTSGGTVAPPAVAGRGAPSATDPVAAAQSQPTASGLSTRDRRIIAGVVIALEVAGFLALRGLPGPGAAAAVPLTAAAAGGRLRPPDRLVGGPRQLSTGGVGRFRRERNGTPPRL